VGRFARGATWAPWFTILGGLYGEPLDAAERDAFLRWAGLSQYHCPRGGWRNCTIIAGRQSGKTSAAAVIAIYEAAIRPVPEDQRDAFVVVMGQDLRSARRVGFQTIRTLIKSSPLLSRLIVSETADTLELENGVRLTVLPCRPAALRGLRCRAVILDELAYFQSSDDRPLDREAWFAAVPTISTTGGRIIAISSAGSPSGLMYDWFEKYYGSASPEMLVLRAPTSELNPTIDAAYLARIEREDPELFDAEFGAQFRAPRSALLEAEVINRALMPDVREVPPRDGILYDAFCDMSGGRSDEAALAIGHRVKRDEESAVVVDLLRAWSPPFDPADVVSEIGGLLRRYRLREVTGDRFGAEWVVGEFKRRGLTYRSADEAKSGLYRTLLAAMNARQVALPADAELVRQLRGLQRRMARSGREFIDHPSGQRDDRANVIAGVVHQILNRDAGVIEWSNWSPLATRSPTIVYRSDGWVYDAHGNSVPMNQAEQFAGLLRTMR
jgi:hypothetical protein